MRRLLLASVLFLISSCTVQIHLPAPEVVVKKKDVEDTLPDVGHFLDGDPEHGGFIVIDGDTIPTEYSKTIGGIPTLPSIDSSVYLLTIHGPSGNAVWKKFTSATAKGFFASGVGGTTYKEEFPAHASSTIAVTANGGVLPANESAIRVYFDNGQEISSDYWSVSGSDILLTFTPPGNQSLWVEFVI